MIYIFVALIAGAVGACLAVFFMADRFPKREQKAENSTDSDSLNEEKRRRAERKADLDKQFDNLMAYTGKEQKKA